MQDKIKSTEEEFDDLEALFPMEEDQEIIKSNRTIYKEAKDLFDYSISPGGRALIKSLKDDIAADIKKLIETREGRYLSDLDSHLSLLTKLTDAKNQSESIRSWIDTLDK